jgi:hypothetical protein
LSLRKGTRLIESKSGVVTKEKLNLQLVIYHLNLNVKLCESTEQKDCEVDERGDGKV